MKVLLSIILLLMSFNAQAYDCWNTSPLRERIKNADVAFIGEVTDIAPMDASLQELGTPRTKVTFKVYEEWKGAETETIKLDTESFYQYDFKKGKIYFVYGYKLYPERISMVGCPRVEELTKESYQALWDVATPEQIFLHLPTEITNKNFVPILDSTDQQEEDGASDLPPQEPTTNLPAP